MRPPAGHLAPLAPARLLAVLRGWFRREPAKLPGIAKAELDWLVAEEQRKARPGMTRAGAVARLRARLRRLG